MLAVARHSRRFILLLAAAAALPAAAAAQATWDDLPNGSFVATPLPYHGFDFYYGDGTFGLGYALQYSTLGAACRSGTNCAYNASANTPIRVESTAPTSAAAFTFSGYLAGGYPGFSAGPGYALAQGFVGTSTTPVFSTLLTVADGVWSSASFTSTNINKLLITPSDANGNAQNGYLLLDDVTFGTAAAPGPVTSTPEPATFALLGAGLAAFGIARRRRA